MKTKLLCPYCMSKDIFWNYFVEEAYKCRDCECTFCEPYEDSGTSK